MPHIVAHGDRPCQERRRVFEKSGALGILDPMKHQRIPKPSLTTLPAKTIYALLQNFFSGVPFWVREKNFRLYGYRARLLCALEAVGWLPVMRVEAGLRQRVRALAYPEGLWGVLGSSKCLGV